ncbi:hypothetical protein [Enterobacter asburiae]|uniref:hypothetical protein n=1 Tax=Enterobacter asburiae TaxID=61645 RepID=UPI003CF5F9A6
MGVNRDLQAKKMRPNVPVPSRRKVIPFLKMMHQETGSMLKAILAFGFDGPWTSSGGSFRLAREIGFDIAHYAKNIHHKNGESHLPGNWCRLGGFSALRNVPAIRRRFPGFPGSSGSNLGKAYSCTSLISHRGMHRCQKAWTEHPYVTAAGLGALENRGVQAGEVDYYLLPGSGLFRTGLHGFPSQRCTPAERGWRPDSSTMTLFWRARWMKSPGSTDCGWSDVSKWEE